MTGWLPQTPGGVWLQNVFLNPDSYDFSLGRVTPGDTGTTVAFSAAFTERIRRSGDAMGGPLTLFGSPGGDMDAANKLYVDVADQANAAAIATKLPLAGGTMTGFLELYSDPQQPMEAANKRYVDLAAVGGVPAVLLAGGTMTGPLILSGDPTAAAGAATKQYVDSRIQNPKATGGTVNRPLGDWLSDAVNVRAYGAKGDGTGDDTLAVQTAFAYAQAHGKSVYVPGGTYLLSSAITWANAPLALRGDGPGVSIFSWSASASSWGIDFSANADTQVLCVEDIGLWAAGTAGTALLADYSAEIIPAGGTQVTSNRSAPRVSINNLWIRSNGLNVGWACGVDIVSGLVCNINNLFIEGWRTNNSIASSYGMAVGVRMRGTGHPVQLVMGSISIYAAQNAIEVDAIEGLHVSMANLVAVQNGILFDATADTAGTAPLCVVTGSHINACGAAVYAVNIGELILSNNDFYLCGDILPTGGAGYGVFVTGPGQSVAGRITSNTFTNSADSSSAILTGVYLSHTDNFLVDDNSFRAYTHGIVNGIDVQATCRTTKIGDGNKFFVDYGTPSTFGFEVSDLGLQTDLPVSNVVVCKTTNASIPGVTATNLVWESLQSFNANNAMFSLGSPTIITIAVKGWYRVSANLHWAQGAGFRDVFIIHNGGYVSGFPWNSIAASTSWEMRQTVTSGPVLCNIGDTFSVRVNISEVSTLLGDASTWFSVEKLG